MNFEKLSTELARISESQRKNSESIERKIVALTAALPPSSTNEMETMRREFATLQLTLMEKIAEQKLSYENQLAEAKTKTEQVLYSLRKENEIVRREMVEQLLFYENQRAEDRSKAEQASAVQEAKVDKMREDLEDLRGMTSSKIAEFVVKGSETEEALNSLRNVNQTMRQDFAVSQTTLIERLAELKLSADNNQLAQTRAKTDEVISTLKDENEAVHRAMTEQKNHYENLLANERAEAGDALTSLKNENQTIRQALIVEKTKTKEALAKIAGMADQISDYDKKLSEINEFNRVEADITRQIHRAFEECPYFEKTQEKVKRIYVKVKKDKAEKCLKTQDLVDEIKKSQNKMPVAQYVMLHRSESIIARERLSQDPVPSLDYIKLVLALSECV